MDVRGIRKLFEAVNTKDYQKITIGDQFRASLGSKGMVIFELKDINKSKNEITIKAIRGSYPYGNTTVVHT